MEELKIFLDKHRVPPKTPFTHTSSGKGFKGSYFINDKELDKFHDVYTNALKNSNKMLTLLEKPKETNTIRIDIDLEFGEMHKKRQYDEGLIKKLVDFYQKVAKVFFKVNDNNLIAYVFEKDAPRHNKEKKKVKDGIHIMFPNMHVHNDAQLVLRDCVMNACEEDQIFEAINVTNSIDNIIDKQVISHNNWTMYGSTTKEDHHPYRLTKIFDHDLKKVDFNHNNLLELVKKFSVRREGNDIQIRDNKKMREIIKSIKKKDNRKKRITSNKTTSINVKKGRYEDIEILVGMLDKKRAEDQHTWMEVGWCLRNISKNLLYAWDDFSKQSNKYKEGECEELWEKMRYREDGLNIGALRYWAKQDDAEGYGNYINEYMKDKYKVALITKTSYDIAVIIREEFNGAYVFDGERWYEYKGNKWYDVEKYPLRNKISEEIREKFNELNKKMSDSEDDDESSEIFKVIRQLKTTAFKDNVMKECKELFYKPNFRNRLNEKINLMGFENGVLNLDTGEFRDGLPEDNLTFSTGIDFIEFKPNDPKMKELLKFLSEIMPNKKDREYLLKSIARCMHGYNAEEIFIIWIGLGRNGKTKLLELIEKSFGDYHIKLPEAMLTQKRPSTTSANPYLASTKGVRYASMEETSENSKINEGFMKDFTGGGTATARELYSKQIMKFKPQAKLSLLCNKPPIFNGNDPACQARVICIQFPSKFVDNPQKPNEKKIDRSISKKLDGWTEHFMSLLFQFYGLYVSEGLNPTDSIKSFTRKYQRSNDVFGAFIDDNVEMKEGSNIKIKDLYKRFKEWYQDNNGYRDIPKRKDVIYYFTTNFSEPDKKTGWSGMELKAVEPENIGNPFSMNSSSLDQ